VHKVGENSQNWGVLSTVSVWTLRQVICSIRVDAIFSSSIMIIVYDCLLSIAVACATAGSDQWYRPGFESGPGREIRSSEFRHIWYRINILSSQLSTSSIDLVPAYGKLGR